jgi:hypothetical protein
MECSSVFLFPHGRKLEFDSRTQTKAGRTVRGRFGVVTLAKSDPHRGCLTSFQNGPLLELLTDFAAKKIP